MNRYPHHLWIPHFENLIHYHQSKNDYQILKLCFHEYTQESKDDWCHGFLNLFEYSRHNKEKANIDKLSSQRIMAEIKMEQTDEAIFIQKTRLHIVNELHHSTTGTVLFEYPCTTLLSSKIIKHLLCEYTVPELQAMNYQCMITTKTETNVVELFVYITNERPNDTINDILEDADDQDEDVDEDESDDNIDDDDDDDAPSNDSSGVLNENINDENDNMDSEDEDEDDDSDCSDGAPIVSERYRLRRVKRKRAL